MYRTTQQTRVSRNEGSRADGLTVNRDVSEMVLVDRCKAGDSRAWEILIDRYEPSVFKFAYSLCRNYEETGDIVGQVFLRLYQNIHTFRSEASFTAWLFRIVRNTYLDLCIRPAHRSHLSLDARRGSDDKPQQTLDIIDPAPSPDTLCVNYEKARLLAQAIRYLPAYQREVLKLYHTEGKSYEEIARSTGLPIGTIKSRLNRARTTLRERLTPDQDTFLAA